MPLPPFGITLVVYIACGGLLWFTAHLFAPVGYQVSLGRGMGTAFLFGISNTVVPGLLKPFVGGWYLLVLILLHVMLVKSVLWLTFWRSMVTVVIYWIGVSIGIYALFYAPWARGGVAPL